MNIYKLVFDTEAIGKQVLIDNNVWEEVTEEGVTFMKCINGTKGVVNIGKVVKIPGTYDPDGHEITPPVYYPGWAYDFISTDVIDLSKYEVYPGDKSVHSFAGYPRGAEIPRI